MVENTDKIKQDKDKPRTSMEAILESGEGAEKKFSDAGSESEIREIVDKILAGEKELFDKIMTRYRSQIFHMAWKMTNHYDDALDVTQMVFLRVFQALNSWKGKSKFSTWLYRIAMNSSIDYLRRYSKHEKKRVHELDDGDKKNLYETILEGVSKDDPRRHLELLELRKKIQSAVAQLKGKQRKCFMLRHYHDHSIKEIAEIMSCSDGTVKRHLHRAAQKLKILLLS